MSYEKFLMQLRHIGKQMMILGAGGMLFSLFLFLTTGTGISVSPYCALCLAGVAVYPTTSEE